MSIEREIREVVLPELGLRPRVLGVTVRDGHVVLTGEAERETDAACLPRAMRYVPGVVDVEFRVAVGSAR